MLGNALIRILVFHYLKLDIEKVISANSKFDPKPNETSKSATAVRTPMKLSLVPASHRLFISLNTKYFTSIIRDTSKGRVLVTKLRSSRLRKRRSHPQGWNQPKPPRKPHGATTKKRHFDCRENFKLDTCLKCNCISTPIFMQSPIMRLCSNRTLPSWSSGYRFALESWLLQILGVHPVRNCQYLFQELEILRHKNCICHGASVTRKLQKTVMWCFLVKRSWFLILARRPAAVFDRYQEMQLNIMRRGSWVLQWIKSIYTTGNYIARLVLMPTTCLGQYSDHL